jgi:signal transduction histidine kinase
MNELILIVEDEGDVAELLRYNLQKNGYRTVVADDGAQALRAVQYGNPDLILLDIMLPEMDGWDVCRIIRDSEQAPTVPIIMVTALSLEEARIQGLRIGADDYITKPFSVHELLLKVRKTLDKERTMKELRQKISEQVTSRSYLVHELRNSLSLVEGYAHLATTKQPEPAYLHQIHSAVGQMGQVLDQISLFDRLENGKGVLNLKPVEIVPIVEEAVESFRRAIHDGALNISLSNPTRTTVMGNAAALRQVVINLLSNAVKFNRPGGRIQVSIHESDQNVCLEVQDDGTGISEQDLPRIFDKFFRGSGTAGSQGSGLGLHIVRLLTEAMQGTVAATSSPGNGTIVIVTLQRAQVPVSESCGTRISHIGIRG